MKINYKVVSILLLIVLIVSYILLVIHTVWPFDFSKSIELKDVIYYIISIFGIGVTGYFSFLLWKTGERTLAFQREVESFKRSTSDAFKQNYFHEIIKSLQYITMSLVKENENFNSTAIVNSMLFDPVSDPRTKAYLSDEQIALIKDIKSETDKYFKKNWKFNGQEVEQKNNNLFRSETDQLREYLEMQIDKLKVSL